SDSPPPFAVRPSPAVPGRGHSQPTAGLHEGTSGRFRLDCCPRPAVFRFLAAAAPKDRRARCRCRWRKETEPGRRTPKPTTSRFVERITIAPCALAWFLPQIVQARDPLWRWRLAQPAQQRKRKYWWLWQTYSLIPDPGHKG